MKAYIGIGSNLGNRLNYIKRAIRLMGEDARRISSVYETTPVGMRRAGKFLNTVVEIETNLKPMDLLEYLEEIEKKLGRKGKGLKRSRTIDLDILLYGRQRINTPRLQIPHPKMHEREFVLKPLSELWGSRRLYACVL